MAKNFTFRFRVRAQESVFFFGKSLHGLTVGLCLSLTALACCIRGLDNYRAKLIVGLPPRLHQNYFLRKQIFCKQNVQAKKVFFATTTLSSALFSPFLALFGPFFTLINAKVPYLAHVCEIFPPISPLCLHFLPSQMPGYHNQCYPDNS